MFYCRHGLQSHSGHPGDDMDGNKTMLLNGIGLHILFDGVSTASDQGKLITFLDRTRPRVINILGGARRDQAWEFAKACLIRYPGMRVIFRIWPDDGNHVKDIYRDPANWIRMATPFLASGVTVLVDNESTTGDYYPYAQWMAAIMDITATKGWKVAVGRTPTGNPGDGNGGSADQYYQLKPMLQALARHGGLHTYSPNEYQGQNYLPSATPGHTMRYWNMVEEGKKYGCVIPDISIGEYGISYQEKSGWMNPGKGWREVQGLNGLDYAKKLVSNFRSYYQSQNVAVSVYSWGDSLDNTWRSFRVDNDIAWQNEIIASAESGMLQMRPIGWTPATPQPILVGYRVVLPFGNTYVNTRAGWTVRDPILSQLRNGDIVRITQSHVDTNGILWYYTDKGWCSTQGKPGQPRIKFIQT